MHPPPAAENSFHPVPSLVLSSVPTEDVLRRRKKDYGFARLLFAIWSMLALVLLAQFALLLFGGWSSILKLFVIMHAPAIDLVYLLIPCGAGIYIGYAMWQGVDQFFRIRAFRKLYDTCRSIDPVRLARCRLAHVMLQRPSRFTYAFSSSKMVVCVGNKQAQEKPQDAPGIDALEGTEDTLNLPTSTAQGQEWQAARPIIGESTLVPTLSVVEAEGKQEEGLASGRDREPDVTGVERKLGFLVRIHQSVSLALVEERGTGSPESVETTQKEVSLLGNIYYEALVARLAIRGKEKVESNKLMKEIYGNRIEEKRSMQQLFYDDKRRIDAQIKKCLERWFPEMAASMDRFKLFEHRKKLWYLSSRCVVRGAEILNYWYRKIKAMRQGDDRSVIPEQELQSIASRFIKMKMHLHPGLPNFFGNVALSISMY
jgi:hypothetical protein